MPAHRIAIIGVGKISQDQHLPVIDRSADFELVGVASQRRVAVPGVPTFRTPAELYEAVPGIDAVAICTPPGVRHAIALEALDAGKHVLLEKPPTQTTAELADLADRAARAGLTIFTTWHSQYNAAVEETRRRLAGQRLRSLAVDWKEDVRRWHPGQEWIWEPGGFGVFDPGINALSILTRIMPAPIFIRSAELVYPANRDMPIAARLVFWSSAAAEPAGSALTAEFDWRQTGDQTWTIAVETEAGQTMQLSLGGAKLVVDGELVIEEPAAEYEAIYRRFATLLERRDSAFDAAPFGLVADAFLVGRRIVAEPFVQ